MTTTTTYTLNSTTAHSLRIGDHLNDGKADFTVLTILPCGRGYRITIRLEDGRNVYLEKCSDFYGMEVIHTEEIPDPVSAPSAPSEAGTAPAYKVDEVTEFEYTGGNIWVTCGYVRDTTTGERFFFDSSIAPSAYVETVNIYSEYPYEAEGDEVNGCSFMPLPNYTDLFRECFDPDESPEGRALWREILDSDLVRGGYVNAYRDEFLALVADPAPEEEYTLTRDDSVTITRYTCGEGFFCDIEETADGFEAWLGHKDCAARDYMFGSSKEQSFCTPPYTQTLEEFLAIVEANLPEYIEDYRDEHLDD